MFILVKEITLFPQNCIALVQSQPNIKCHTCLFFCFSWLFALPRSGTSWHARVPSEPSHNSSASSSSTRSTFFTTTAVQSSRASSPERFDKWKRRRKTLDCWDCQPHCLIIRSVSASSGCPVISFIAQKWPNQYLNYKSLWLQENQTAL